MGNNDHPGQEAEGLHEKPGFSCGDHESDQLHEPQRTHMARQTVKGRLAAHSENGPQVSKSHEGHSPQEEKHTRQPRQSEVHQQARDAGIKDALIEALLEHAVLVDFVVGVEVINVRHEA